MPILRTLIALAALLLLGSCTIESDTLLTDLGKPGDPIAGFPADKPFKIVTFSPGSDDGKAFATLTPQKSEPGTMLYMMSFDDGTPNKLLVQARYLSDGNYLLRFVQVIDGMLLELDQSGLAFLSRQGDDWRLLTAVGDDGSLEEIFGKAGIPAGSYGSVLKLTTFDEARKVSDWFAKHAGNPQLEKDFSRFRIVE
jgi:hypothetical protein